MSPSYWGDAIDRSRSRVGSGRQIRGQNRFAPLRFNDFQSGLISSDSTDDVPANASPDMLDVELNKADALVKSPGTAEYLPLGESPTQVALNVGSTFEAELVMMGGPAVMIHDETGTTAIPAGLVDNPLEKYSWTTFGDWFIFSNMIGDVLTHEFGTIVVGTDPAIPVGRAYATIAGRVFVGGAFIAGNRERMGVYWSAPGLYNDFTGPGAGFEILIDDQTEGDEIMAIRAMGLDVAAIICRNSVWIGRRTEELDRPLDFQPRVRGKGCINKQTALTVYGGVIYLSKDGVEFFDGNNSTSISSQIDSTLLPLDLSKILEYSASYNSLLQRYYLYTPYDTYVYDIKYRRWYRRSLIALAGVTYGEPADDLTWEDMLSPWEDTSGSWASLDGADGVPQQLFLGTLAGERQFHVESPESYTNFGQPFKPYWSSKTVEGDMADLMVTVNAIRLKYKSEGSVNLYLPNFDADYVQVNANPVGLPLALRKRLINRRSMHTGLGAGIKIEFLSGSPEIYQLEISAMARSQRMSSEIKSSHTPNF